MSTTAMPDDTAATNTPAAPIDLDEPAVVCFDLGGVVVRICRSWAEAARRVGLPEELPPEAHEPTVAEHRHALTEDYQCGGLATDEYFELVAQTTAGACSADDIRRIHLTWIIEEYPGVLALVEELNAQPHITTACLSNTNDAHWRAMLGLDAPTFAECAPASPAVCALKHQLASHDLQASKPGELIYHKAREHFGVAPERIVFFDDLAENIHTARALGWRAHRIDHAGDTASQVRAHLSALGVLAPVS